MSPADQPLDPPKIPGAAVAMVLDPSNPGVSEKCRPRSNHMIVMSYHVTGLTSLWL